MRVSISNYEKLRMERIEQNKLQMEMLGLIDVDAKQKLDEIRLKKQEERIRQKEEAKIHIVAREKISRRCKKEQNYFTIKRTIRDKNEIRDVHGRRTKRNAGKLRKLEINKLPIKRIKKQQHRLKAYKLKQYELEQCDAQKNGTIPTKRRLLLRHKKDACLICGVEVYRNCMRQHVGAHIIDERYTKLRCGMCGSDTSPCEHWKDKSLESIIPIGEPCPMYYEYNMLQDKSICSNMPVKCPKCSKWFWKYTMKKHLTDEHDGFQGATKSYLQSISVSSMEEEALRQSIRYITIDLCSDESEDDQTTEVIPSLVDS